ncbi:MAG: AraC family transcriptional regulator [Pseudomonadota bacterium]
MGMITSLFARKMAAAAGPSVDASALLTEAGLDPDAPWDPKVMIRDVVYYDLLERLAKETDATALPIAVGASMRCDDYGALGLAWKAAPTLLGSFQRVERYARLWTSVVEYALRPADGGMLFVLNRSGAPRLGLRLSNEATLASAVSISRQVSPEPFAPMEVMFRHGAPKTLEHHEAYFGCPVRFEAELDALLISHGALARPNRLGDAGITRFLLSHLDSELKDLPQEDALEARTKDAIARSLSEGLPKVADIARGLGLSARSYHRRLAEQGLSFQALAEATRRELAEGLLQDDRHSLAEIAFLTGFSEQSAFTRAFKRWVGRTPASYRKASSRKDRLRA